MKCKKCKSEDIRFVKFTMANGVKMLRKQCFSCGYLFTENYKRSIVPDFDSLPEMDKRLRQNQRENSIEKSKIKKVLSNYAHYHFFRQMRYYRNVYLKSDEWQHKRNLIMDFYDWKCQKCNGKAKDLHHITYDNIFKEKFDDLIPLCRSCHEKEHDINL